MDWKSLERGRAKYYRIAEKQFFEALMDQLDPVIQASIWDALTAEEAARLIGEGPIRDKFEYIYKYAGGDYAEKIYKNYSNRDVRQLFDKFMEDYVRDNAGFKITSITNVTREDARRIISDVIAENSNLGAGALGRKISTALSDKGGKIARYRSRMIARTEVAAASNIGMQAGAEQTGLPMVKEWLHSGGKDARISHEAMSGQMADINGYFIFDDGTRMYTPHDPSAPPEHVINCRCGLTYKVRPDFKL